MNVKCKSHRSPFFFLSSSLMVVAAAAAVVFVIICGLKTLKSFNCRCHTWLMQSNSQNVVNFCRQMIRLSRIYKLLQTVSHHSAQHGNEMESWKPISFLFSLVRVRVHLALQVWRFEYNVKECSSLGCYLPSQGKHIYSICDRMRHCVCDLFVSCRFIGSNILL